MRARVIFCLLAYLALALPSLAEDGRGAPSLDRVLPQIRRSTPGTFYDAEGPFTGPDGSPTYRIKWMTPEGRIIWFYADGRTGRVLGSGPGPGPGPNPMPHPMNVPPSHFQDGPGAWPGPGGGDGNGRWNRGGRDWNGRGGDGRGGDWRGRGGDWNGGNDGNRGRGQHGG